MLHFIDETNNPALQVQDLDEKEVQYLVDYAAGKAIEVFYRVNQYYTFDATAKTGLKQIYVKLVEAIRSGKESMEKLSESHYRNLRNWLQESNPYAANLYRNAGDTLTPVVCSEYSPELQMAVFHLDLNNIRQPLLDLGCGRSGNLVQYLLNKGIEAEGIDRYDPNEPAYVRADWLEYDYGPNRWGTIVSKLGFSNHFMYHHLRQGGNFRGYAKTYMKILLSLKRGRAFHYAPNLPFVEKHLDKQQYQVIHHAINPGGSQAAIVKKY